MTFFELLIILLLVSLVLSVVFSLRFLIFKKNQGCGVASLVYILFIAVIVGFIYFLFFREHNPCRRQQLSTITRVVLYDFPELPESARLYIFRKNNGFVRAIDSVEYRRFRESNRFTIGRWDSEGEFYYGEVEIISFDFRRGFLRNRDYRIVINDTIFFDVSDMIFDVHRSGLWGKMGELRSCGTFGMKINGKPLCETYLPAFHINLPYSMGRIVHNDSKTISQ